MPPRSTRKARRPSSIYEDEGMDWETIAHEFGEGLANVVVDRARAKLSELRQRYGGTVPAPDIPPFPGAQPPPPPPPPRPEAPDPYKALGCVRGMPLDVYEATYKALARHLHPDRGGNKDQMAAINAAIKAIRAELKK